MPTCVTSLTRCAECSRGHIQSTPGYPLHYVAVSFNTSLDSMIIESRYPLPCSRLRRSIHGSHANRDGHREHGFEEMQLAPWAQKAGRSAGRTSGQRRAVSDGSPIRPSDPEARRPPSGRERNLLVGEFFVRRHFQISGLLHGLNQTAGVRRSRFEDAATVAARQNAALALEGQTAGARPVIMASDAAGAEDGRDVFLELLRQTGGSEPAQTPRSGLQQVSDSPPSTNSPDPA